MTSAFAPLEGSPLGRELASSPEALEPWAALIGPCYTAESLARELGWTQAQVTSAAASLKLLEVETSDHVLLYPAFQVWEKALVPGLGAVLQVLSTSTASAWTWAQWLNASIADESGAMARSAIEQLRTGRLADVLREATHDAAAWAS